MCSSNHGISLYHPHVTRRVHPDSICKCNARPWAACPRHHLAEFAVPNLVGRFPARDLHGGVADLPDDGLQVRVREVVEAGPLGRIAAELDERDRDAGGPGFILHGKREEIE